MKMYKTTTGLITLTPVEVNRYTERNVWITQKDFYEEVRETRVIRTQINVQYHSSEQEANNFLLERELGALLKAEKIVKTSELNIGEIGARIENYV